MTYQSDDELSEDRLAVLLGRHLSTELDKHAGQAAEWLQREAITRQSSHRRWPATLVQWLGAAAASALVGWSVLAVRISGRHPPGLATFQHPTGGLGVAQVTRTPAPGVRQTLAWRAVDEGTVVLANDVPVRRIRQQLLEEVRWRGQGEAECKLVVPRQQVFYVPMSTY